MSRTPEDQLPYGFTIKNTGNLDDYFDISATSEHNFPLSIVPTGTILLPAKGEYSFYVWVTVPSGYPLSEPFNDLLTVSAQSQFDPSKQDSEQVTTAVNFDVNLSWLPEGTQTHPIAPEDSTFYWRTLMYTSAQTSPYPIDVVFEAHSSHNYTVTVEPPTINGMVAGAGGSRDIKVTVQFPPGAASGTDTVEITATATTVCIARAWATDILQIAQVTLSPDYDRAVTPGTATVYSHILSNTGAVTDTYAVTYADTLGWSPSVTPTLVYTLPPGSAVPVTATVVVPTGLLSGTRDTLVITATSQTVLGLFDTATDATSVARVRSAILAPDQSGHAPPNGTVTYTHALTNTGNYTETFLLSTNSGQMGYAVVSPTEATLGPGQVYTPVQVVVRIRESGGSGEVEPTQVTALFVGPPFKQVTAIDLTTVDFVPGPRYVAQGGWDQIDQAVNNCTRVDNPCATVQHAVDQASPGDLVRVAQGIYTGTLAVGKSVTLTGGYTTTDQWGTSNPVQRPTILDAQGLGRAISLTGAINPTVAGFKITRGGVYIEASRPVTIVSNILYNNSAADGGAVYLNSGSLFLQNNILYSNSATDLGGGVYVSGAATLVNNTLYANSAYTGGALYQAAGTMLVTNTILMNNTAITGGVAYASAGAANAFAYNDLWGNTNADNITSTNSLWVNPSFQNAAVGDFRLAADSLCIDNGVTVTIGVTTDIEGHARPVEVAYDRAHVSGYDMGAFEFQPNRSVQLDPPSDVRHTVTGPVVYRHVLTNTGQYSDTLALTSAIDQPSWAHQLSPSSVTLGANMTTTVYVTVTWTGTPPIGTVATVYITITSVAGGNNTVLLQTTDTTHYHEQADVAIVKSVTPTSWLGPGSAVTYTLVYSNNGPASAVGIVITDQAPLALTGVGFASSPALSARNGITYVWDLASLPLGKGIVTVTGVVSESPGLVTFMSNTAQIASAQQDLTPTNDVDSVVSWIDTEAPTAPELDSPADHATTATQTINFTWLPSTDGSGSQVAGYEFVISGSVYYTRSTVAASPATAVNLPYDVYTWTARAFDYAGNQSDYAPSRVITVGLPVLTVTKQATPAGVLAGAPFTYVITVSDTGPVAATNVVVTDAVPSGANYISGGSYDSIRRVVTWTVPALDPVIGRAQVTFVVTACQMVTNTSYRVVTSTEGISGTWGAATAAPVTPPTIAAAFVQSALQTGINQPVYFTDTTATNGGPIVGWGWSWGDGTRGTGMLASHTYTTANTFTVTQRVTDTCSYSSVATSTITIIDPRVELTKLAPPEVDAGARLTYTLLVSNTGYNPLTSVQVTDTLPVFIVNGGQTSRPVSGTIMPGATITWTIGSLDVGQSISMTLVVTVTSPLTNGTGIANLARATSAQGASYYYIATTVARSAPILSIVKTALTSTVPAGLPLTYTIRYTNTGNANATGVVITDALPLDIAGGRASPPPSSGVISAGQVVTWSGLSVPGAGGWSSITLVVTATRPLSNGVQLVNQAYITSAQGVGSSSAPVTVTVFSSPALAVRKLSAPSGNVSPGDWITYTLIVTNTGTEDAASTTITDATPLSTTFVSAGIASPAAGSIVSPGLGMPGTVVWQLSTPITAPGGSAAVTFTVRVDSPLNNRTPITNSGYNVTAVDAATPVSGSPVTHTVIARPDLKITKSAPPAVPANTPLTYTVRYTNTGNGNATGVVITDRLPLSITGGYASPSPSSGVINAGQAITWSGLYVPGDGGSGSVTLVVTVARSLVTGTVLLNTAGITCSEGVSATTGLVAVTTYHGDPASLTIAPTGVTVQAGFTRTYAVTGTDTYNNVWNATREVTFTIGAGGYWGTPPGNNVFTATTPTGLQVITATASNGASITTTVNVTVGVPVSLTIFPRAATVTAGDWVNYTAIVTDAYGNGGYDTISTTFTANGGGVFTNGNVFSATVAGTWIVTGVHAPGLVNTATLAVNPGPMARLMLGTVPSQTAGQPFSLMVTALDAFGNVAVGSGVISLTDSTGTLLPTTSSSWSGGVATPTVAITRALVGDQITVTMAATPTIWRASNLFTVLPNVPAWVTLGVNPVSIPLGATARLTTTVVDAYANPVANGTRITLTTTAGALPNGQTQYTSTTTFGVAMAALTATCTAQSITLTAQAGAAVTQTNASFTAPGVPYTVSLALGSYILPVGGVTTTLTATVRDCATGGGNLVSNGTPVTFTIAPISADIVPSTTATTGGNAVVTLTSPTKAGSSVITATSGAAWARTIITFTPLAPFTVTVSALPPKVAPTSSASVIAGVTDRYSNWVANGTAVTFTVADLGVITPPVTSTVNGQAVVRFTAGITLGTAIVTATVDSALWATTTISISLSYVYLPVVLRDYSPPVPGKNLIVSSINPATDPMSVMVVIKNMGTLAVTEEFGVSLYVDPPDPSQIKVDRPWYWVGCTYGMIWTVSTPIQPGQSLTLTVQQADLRPGYYNWPPGRGSHSLWALVDAWSASGTDPGGLVQETNESDNKGGPVTLNVP